MLIKKTGEKRYDVTMTIDERSYIWDALLKYTYYDGGDLEVIMPAQKGEPYEIIIKRYEKQSNHKNGKTMTLEKYLLERLEDEMPPEVRAAIAKGNFDIDCKLQPSADGRAKEWKITISTIL